MFNAEKLLGGMLRQGLKGGAPSGELFSSGGLLSTRAAAGLGLLAVAWEAAEHYLGKGEAVSPPASPSVPPSAPPVAPPPAPATPGAATPPPPPLSNMANDSLPATPDANAVACMQAMIAAAWADGSLDGQERAAIFNGLDSLHLTPEEISFLHRELAAPKSPAELAALAATPEQAAALYAAACMAIVADTAAEHAFLEELAARLHLDPALARSLKRE